MHRVLKPSLVAGEVGGGTWWECQHCDYGDDAIFGGNLEAIMVALEIVGKAMVKVPDSFELLSSVLGFPQKLNHHTHDAGVFFSFSPLLPLGRAVGNRSLGLWIPHPEQGLGRSSQWGFGTRSQILVQHCRYYTKFTFQLVGLPTVCRKNIMSPS